MLFTLVASFHVFVNTLFKVPKRTPYFIQGVKSVFSERARPRRDGVVPLRKYNETGGRFSRTVEV